MYELGGVNEAELNRLGTEAGMKNAEAGGKDFNQFNVMFLRSKTDTFVKGGMPMDPSRTSFPLRGSVTFEDQRRLTLVDTPGYGQMFLDNIIYGVYIADVALLLVEAKVGLRSDRANVEHRSGAENIAKILASFRVPVVAILVTKMDAVGYSQSAFEEVKEEVELHVWPILKPYHSEQPPIIPISALSRVGITTTSVEDAAWYSGVNVLQVIEQTKVTTNRPTDKVRFAIEGGKEVYSPPGVGTVLVGSLESGMLHSNDRLILEPASTKRGEAITIHARSIQRARSVTEKRGVTVSEIASRAIVAIATTASELSRKDAEIYLSHGGILGLCGDPPRVATEIKAELIFFERGVVYSGKDYAIYPNASRGTARIRQIESRGTLEPQKGSAYEAGESERMVAILRMAQPICIECSDEFRRLTRFVLREQNSIVACGRCIEILR